MKSDYFEFGDKWLKTLLLYFFLLSTIFEFIYVFICILKWTFQHTYDVQFIMAEAVDEVMFVYVF